MGWRLRVEFDDGSSELVDEVFKTREDAEDAKEAWLCGWGTGQEVLELAGEPFCDKGLEDFDIWEE